LSQGYDSGGPFSEYTYDARIKETALVKKINNIKKYQACVLIPIATLYESTQFPVIYDQVMQHLFLILLSLAAKSLNKLEASALKKLM